MGMEDRSAGDSRDIRKEFAARFGPEQAGRARLAVAPGRVNLIGEHTDYNEGFVFPMAIGFELRLLGAVRDDEIGEAVEFDLRDGARDEARPWSNYLRGVFWALGEAGFPLRGLDVLISGDIPQGAGLSSSAAFEIAAALLLQELCSP